MLPNPLHPAIVHFPVVLAILLPIFAVGALWAIRRGTRPLVAWSVPMAVAAALMLSTWAAVQTGQSQEEVVEPFVADAPLDAHEEAAETFTTATAIVLLLVGVGLVPGRTGKYARVAGTLGAVALVVGAGWVGHSGGQLVYRHGAASAYARPALQDGRVSMGSQAGQALVNSDDDDR